MADIAGLYKSNQSYNPKIDYNVSYSETGRNGSSVTYSFTVSFNRLNGSYGFDIMINYSIGGQSGNRTLKANNDWSASGSTSWSVTCSTDAAGGTLGARIYSWSNTDSTHSQNGFDTGSRTVNKSTFNTAPSAPGTLYADGSSSNKYIPENYQNVGLSWGAASDPNGNLSGYRVRVSVNGGSYTQLGTTGNLTYTHYVGDYPEGTTLAYVIDAYDSYGLYGGNSNTVTLTKNVLNNGGITGISNGVYFDTGSFTVNFTRGSNNNGATVYEMCYSDNVTVYNLTELTSGTSQTISIWRSGGFPSGPYIKFDDLKNYFASSSYNGNLHIGLRTRNDFGNYKWAGSSVWIDLRTAPQPATNQVISTVNTESTVYRRHVGTNLWYFVPNGSGVIRVKWTDGWGKLGEPVRYEVYVAYGSGGWNHIANVNSGVGYYNHVVPTQSYSQDIKYLVKCITSYGTPSDAVTPAQKLHFYNKPVITIGTITRGATTADVKITIRSISSIPGINTTGSWERCAPGTTTPSQQTGSLLPTQGEQNIALTGLTDAGMYDLIVTYNDSTGFTAAGDVDPKTIPIGQNSPILFVNKYGIGVNGNKATSDYAVNVKGTILADNIILKAPNIAAESGTTRPAQEGLQARMCYQNGYPYDYGNAITIKGAGDSQLFMGWSGTSGAHADLHYRSKRDTGDANWSPWAKLWTSANLNPYSMDGENTGWFRCSGNQGIYWSNWNGGWYMEDSTWIRAYNGKSIYTPSVIRCDGGFQLAPNATLSWDSAFIKSNGSSYMDLYAPNMSPHFETSFTVYKGSPGSGSHRFEVNDSTTISYRDFWADRWRGRGSSTRQYIGPANARLDCTDDCYARLYCATWAAGAADNGSFWSPYGGMAIKVGGTSKHDLRADGSKVGGSIELDGITYGMSPTDSPRSMIEDVIFDQLVEGKTKVLMNPVFARSIAKVAVFPSSPKVEVIEKGSDYFILESIEPITCDIRVIGTRIDHSEQYYEIMGGIVHGDEKVVSH